MTLSVNPINDALWANIQALRINKSCYKEARSSLKLKLKDPVPAAKNCAFQEVMNTTYALYQEGIRSCLSTLRIQYQLGKEIEVLFSTELDPIRLFQSMTDFKTQYHQLLEGHQATQVEISHSIEKMIELMSSDNPPL